MKWFSSDMAGAPVLNGTAGSLIGVLNACLITGFGMTTVRSGTVADGQAVLTVDNANGYKPEATLLIEGVTGTCAALNGERRIVAVTTNTITVKATGVANGTLDGAVTLKYAPAGWTSPFTDTNVAVYKQGDVTATGVLLRVDDTAPATVRVCGYESMTDAHTGDGKTPSQSQIAGGGWWPKSSNGSVAVNWHVFASGSYVYYSCYSTTPLYRGQTVFAGDIDAHHPHDNSAWVLTCGTSNSNQTAYGSTCSVQTSGSRSGYFVRSLSNSAISIPSFWVGVQHNNVSNVASSGAENYSYGEYSGTEQNVTLPTCDVLLYESPTSSLYILRGKFPRLLHVATKVSHNLFQDGEIVRGTHDLNGRTLMAITSNGNGHAGAYLFDISE